MLTTKDYAERKITMNIDISTSEKLHEYLMSLVEREKRTGVPSSAEELAPAIEEMFRRQAELQRRLDKLSKRKKTPRFIDALRDGIVSFDDPEEST